MDKINEFVGEVVDLSLKSLSEEFTYLAYPLGKIYYGVEGVDGKLATNGKNVFFNGDEVVKNTALNGVKEISAWILHVLMHCIFLHPFKKPDSVEIQDLAFDITVGYILDSLGYFNSVKSVKEGRKSVYKAIIDKFGGVNDESCLEYCRSLTKREVLDLQAAFKVCSHELWYGRELGKGEQTEGDGVSLAFDTLEEEEIDDLKSEWSSVARNLIPKIGKLNPSLKRMISVSVGEGGNYKSFLRSFLRRRERIRPSDEEFDYIYYCLGLQSYGNVPLIENLEYSDRRDYSDVAIAVDTSGSTDGEPIKKLLKEVFALVKSMETESERYRLRIIQCDLKVQREDVVSSADELASLLENFKLEGGGGTDFRPVFDYLSQLKRKGEKIEGLIYFTDGVGLYPIQVPPFKTCFAILGDNEGVNVPHFAYRIDIED